MEENRIYESKKDEEIIEQQFLKESVELKNKWQKLKQSLSGRKNIHLLLSL